MWVTPTDITSNVITTTERKLSDSGKKNARLADGGSILVTCIASIGKNAKTESLVAFNQQINSLTPNKNEHDIDFLLADSENWSKTMKYAGGCLTFQIVNKTEFSNIETIIPQGISEERLIGELFKRTDLSIKQLKTKIEKLRNLKIYFLNKMIPHTHTHTHTNSSNKI